MNKPEAGITLKVSIYEFFDYRKYLKAYLEQRRKNGDSYRSIAKSCEIANPNYFQQVIKEDRNLTAKAAHKIARGFRLNKSELQYLLDLVQLAHKKNVNEEKIFADIRAKIVANQTKRIKDPSISSHWLHQILLEVVNIDGFELTPENILRRVRVNASKEDIQKSIDFLLKKKWIVATNKPHIYRRLEVELETINDLRMVDLHRNHRYFLDQAKHRLVDDLDEREFQGLTVAIPKDKKPEIKKKIRAFMKEISDIADGYQDPDSLCRLQLAFYQLTKDQE